mmetsp:Transcript_3390/g.12691  ORF Transcript_3390/g.12691 Transcript_3390/m.12691 type:complete len:245 (+) Transcript_3390:1483-2217(+)
MGSGGSSSFHATSRPSSSSTSSPPRGVDRDPSPAPPAKTQFGRNGDSPRKTATSDSDSAVAAPAPFASAWDAYRARSPAAAAHAARSPVPTQATRPGAGRRGDGGRDCRVWRGSGRSSRESSRESSSSCESSSRESSSSCKSWGVDAAAIPRRTRARSRAPSGPYAAATRRYLESTGLSSLPSSNHGGSEASGAAATKKAKDLPASRDAGTTRYVHTVPSTRRSRHTGVSASGRAPVSCLDAYA